MAIHTAFVAFALFLDPLWEIGGRVAIIRCFQQPRPITTILCLSPQTCLSPYVESFGRRQASESLRCPNPRAAGDGLWGFRFRAMQGGGGRCRYADGLGSGRSAFRMAVWMSKVGPSDFGGAMAALDQAQCSSSRSPQHGCSEGDCGRAVPDHDVDLPGELAKAGGARG